MLGQVLSLPRKLQLFNELPYAMYLCVNLGKDLTVDFSSRWMASDTDLRAEYM